MNDLEAILKTISQDTENLENSVIQETEKLTGEIFAGYKTKAEKETAAILEAAQGEGEAIHRRALSQAGIEGRGSRLLARRRAMDEAFVQATKELCAMGSDKKALLYADLCAKYGSGESELVLCGTEQATVGPLVLKALQEKAPDNRITLSKDAGNFCGGFVLRGKHMEINCTFETLVAQAKEQLEAEVSAVLFQ